RPLPLRRWPAGTPFRGCVDAAGPVAPVPAPILPRGGRRRPRSVSVLGGGPGALRVLLVRALRLGAGVRQAQAVRRFRRGEAGDGERPGVGARTEPPDA